MLRNIVILFLVSCSQVANSASVSFESSTEGQTVVLIDGKSIADFIWKDAKIPRPYFAELYTLDGVQVTRNHPPNPETDVADHPEYHPGLWMAFGDISGSDYWRNKADVRYVIDSLKTHSGAGSGSLEAKFKYLDQETGKQILCEETLRCRVVVLEGGYLLLWDSRFSSDKPFNFGDQEEMGIGIRVATAIRAEDRARGEIPPGVGEIVDAEGRTNGEQVWGNSAKWCDYRGPISGKTVGIALLCHPDNFRPSWFHARDYGLLVANAFGRKAFRKGDESKEIVLPGDEFHIQYGVFVHSMPQGTSIDLDTIYAEYLKLTESKGD